MTENKVIVINSKYYLCNIEEDRAIIKNKKAGKETVITEPYTLKIFKEEISVANQDWTHDDILRAYVRLSRGSATD